MTTSTEEGYVHTEVPTSLKQLSRLVVRGFYSLEDSLIIDMLVRNPCMKEDDICELLKFERKMLRARISTLKNDKIIQTRLRMETGPDGKAQKVNYYFINYQTFVNIVKYKLDVMRKRMEMEERDATSRSSFKCPRCLKTFTDLEADQLFDIMTQEFRCTFCGGVVEEDLSAMPKKDSRLLLAKFNSQLEPLFVLLREVEGIKLAPELLEPEPVDLSTILGTDKKKDQGSGNSKQWSGEATRNMGFITDDTKVNVMVGDDAIKEAATVIKERPVWMTESTIITNDESSPHASVVKEELMNMSESPAQGSDDIMSVLLQHEKRGQGGKGGGGGVAKEQSDSEDSDSDLKQMMREASQSESFVNENEETMNSEDEDDDDEIPVISVGSQKIAISDIDDKIISEMTPQEKQLYIQVYQEYYSSIYD